MVDLALRPRWLFDVAGRYWMSGGLPRPRNYGTELSTQQLRPLGSSIDKCESLTWNDLRVLRERWPRTLIVKGILHPDDARLAADCGADGIVVSNHGGLVCEGALSPIEALPAIVDAVRDRVTVLIDRGFRRGSDVIKALALGAKAVMVGRAAQYGAAAAGEAGVARALMIFRDEIERTLAMLGCASVRDLRSEQIVLPGSARQGENQKNNERSK